MSTIPAMFPSSEGAYAESIGYLKDYRARLMGKKKSEAQFFARADYLCNGCKRYRAELARRPTIWSSGKTVMDSAAKNI